MSTASWIMLGIHLCLFVYLYITISKKKRVLERENAQISTDNYKLKAENKRLCQMLDEKYATN